MTDMLPYNLGKGSGADKRFGPSPCFSNIPESMEHG